MQPLSSAPAPEPGDGKGTPPMPAPALVPSAPKPRRNRRRLLAGIAATIVAIAGIALFVNTKIGPKVPGPPGNVVIVRTAAVDQGDLHDTVRVTGVISAEKFAALMAPQIRGSRNDRGRGGMGGGSSSSS